MGKLLAQEFDNLQSADQIRITSHQTPPLSDSMEDIASDWIVSVLPTARVNLNANFIGKFFTAPNMKHCTQEIANNLINHSQC